MENEKREETRADVDNEEAGQIWYKALDVNELPEGRVKPVTCAHKTLCMTRFEGKYAALDNKCPHQGGPLGEGSIEQGWLRCPWHGWDFHPLTGKPPGGYDDGVETYPVQEKPDGIYVGLAAETTTNSYSIRCNSRNDGELGSTPRVRYGRSLQSRLG